MSLRLGDIAPDFTAETTEGPIHFHEWIGDHWAILFSHPKDFTPICTTELGEAARLKPEFDRRDTRLIGLSVDSVADHHAWAKDIADTQGHAPNFPIIADTDLNVSKLYDMLPADESGGAQGRTAANNATVRSVFFIGPDKRIKAMLVYPMSNGRNFEEVLRLLDGLQFNATQNLATPVNWRPGDAAVIPTSVSDEAAHQKYPQGWSSPRPYLRFLQPTR